MATIDPAYLNQYTNNVAGALGSTSGMLGMAGLGTTLIGGSLASTLTPQKIQWIQNQYLTQSQTASQALQQSYDPPPQQAQPQKEKSFDDLVNECSEQLKHIKV